MKKNYTEIGLVLDCSSSMNCIKSALIEGFNTLIEEQKKLDGECVFTLTKFSDEVNVGVPTPIENFEPLTYNSYKCQGMTALWKAIDNTIEDMGNRFSLMKEEDRPENVLVVIVTDGEENYSNGNSYSNFINVPSFGPGSFNRSFIPTARYTLEAIKEKIEHQKSVYNWEFLFIGAETLDVANISTGLGIGHSYAFKQDYEGTKSVHATMSADMVCYRSTGKLND